MPLSIAKPVCYLALGGPRGHPGVPLAREHDRSRYVSFLSLPILKPMFIHRTNTLLPLWQSLIWLEYEIVFSFANCTIVDSIFFSHLYSTVRRVCAKPTTETKNLPTRDVPNEAPSKICLRPDVSATWKQIDSHLVASPFVAWKIHPADGDDTGHNIYLVWLHFIVSAHAISSKPLLGGIWKLFSLLATSTTWYLPKCRSPGVAELPCRCWKKIRLPIPHHRQLQFSANVVLVLQIKKSFTCSNRPM